MNPMAFGLLLVGLVVAGTAALLRLTPNPYASAGGA